MTRTPIGHDRVFHSNLGPTDLIEGYPLPGRAGQHEAANARAVPALRAGAHQAGNAPWAGVDPSRVLTCRV
jgi:hypothetical protein